MDSINAVHKALVDLRTRVINKNDSAIIYGICTEYNSSEGIDCSLKSAMETYQIDWKNWPLFSGNPTFPVTITKPSGNGLGQVMPNVNPSELYLITPCRMYWATSIEYGRNRRALLDWLIQQVELKIQQQ